jgi:NTE family protein
MFTGSAFAPIEYGDKIYIDGGYCDNLPTKPLAQICDHIIGINVNPISNNVNYSFKSHLARSMFIMLNHNIKFGKKECDLFIEIKEMGRYSIFDLKNFELFFDFGYNDAKKYDSEIERLL